MSRFSTSRLFVATGTALLLLLLWDLSGLDLPMARLAGTVNGFALRDNKSFELIMHTVPRLLSWFVVIGLLVAIGWPIGFLRKLTRSERIQLAVTALLSVVVTSLLKVGSHTSCPWDVEEFGGIAHYVSHLSWGTRDGGPGGCFPAGHASAAFAYVGGWFVLRRALPGVAAIWIAGALAMGLILGLGQQWRGAHYMSHTLWTGWFCWTTGFTIDLATKWWTRQGASTDLAPR